MERTNKKGTNEESHEEGAGYGPRLNDISKKFISECLEERERIGEDFPMALMLIDEAIERVHTTGRIPGRDMHADVFKQKPMKITQKVFVPVKQFPKFNFNGKILGPKGNSLRRLQEETMCKIGIKGRHSMRDAEKEEEFRQSGDPRHAHLHKDLYVEISTIAPPAEGYARIAYALAEIRKYLIPDKNDEVSQEQLKEILADPESAMKASKFAAKISGRNSFREKLDASRNGVSILQKITGQSFETHVSEDNDYEGSSNGYNSYQPVRHMMSQRPLKRPQPPQQQHQRYQTPQKRPRDILSSGPQKSTPFSFFQKYQ